MAVFSSLNSYQLIQLENLELRSLCTLVIKQQQLLGTFFGLAGKDGSTIFVVKLFCYLKEFTPAVCFRVHLK